MSLEEYDIVFVGAGAAGCVVASCLAEHTDASIALIEAGALSSGSAAGRPWSSSMRAGLRWTTRGGSIRAAALAMGGDWHDLGGSLSDDAVDLVALQPSSSISRLTPAVRRAAVRGSSTRPASVRAGR